MVTISTSPRSDLSCIIRKDAHDYFSLPALRSFISSSSKAECARPTII